MTQVECDLELKIKCPSLEYLRTCVKYLGAEEVEVKHRSATMITDMTFKYRDIKFLARKTCLFVKNMDTFGNGDFIKVKEFMFELQRISGNEIIINPGGTAFYSETILIGMELAEKKKVMTLVKQANKSVDPMLCKFRMNQNGDVLLKSYDFLKTDEFVIKFNEIAALPLEEPALELGKPEWIGHEEEFFDNDKFTDPEDPYIPLRMHWSEADWKAHTIESQ